MLFLHNDGDRGNHTDIGDDGDRDGGDAGDAVLCYRGMRSSVQRSEQKTRQRSSEFVPDAIK